MDERRENANQSVLWCTYKKEAARSGKKPENKPKNNPRGKEPTNKKVSRQKKTHKHDDKNQFLYTLMVSQHQKVDEIPAYVYRVLQTRHRQGDEDEDDR